VHDGTQRTAVVADVRKRLADGPREKMRGRPSGALTTRGTASVSYTNNLTITLRALLCAVARFTLKLTARGRTYT
jgi:hypothetical protein